MDLNMAKQIITQELNNTHQDYRIVESKSSNSIYFKIFFGKTSLQFRISDHSTKNDISTLRIDYKSTAKTIINYVRNRIKDTRDRELYDALNSKTDHVFTLDELEF